MSRYVERIKDVCREYIEDDRTGDDEFRDRDWEAMTGVYRALVGRGKKEKG